MHTGGLRGATPWLHYAVLVGSFQAAKAQTVARKAVEEGKKSKTTIQERVHWEQGHR